MKSDDWLWRYRLEKAADRALGAFHCHCDPRDLPREPCAHCELHTAMENLDPTALPELDGSPSLADLINQLMREPEDSIEIGLTFDAEFWVRLHRFDPSQATMLSAGRVLVARAEGMTVRSCLEKLATETGRVAEEDDS